MIKRLRQSGLTGIEAETDPVLNKLFAERLARGDLAQGAVLDGYPSTKEHADFLAAMVQSDELPSPIVIQLEIPDEEVRRRMAGTNRSAESVEQRLKDYHRELGMLHVYFPNADITKIDGTKKPKKVTKQIRKLLKIKRGA